MNTLCACGCGEVMPADWKPPIKIPNRKPPRFLSGHNCRVMKIKRADAAPPNPSGLCMCGCGQPTSRAKITAGALQVKGEFLRYLRGHWPAWPTRRNPVSPDDPKGPNPSGLCQCGCGGKVGIGDRTDPVKSVVAGCYTRFLRGHDKWRNRPKDVGERSGICGCGCGQKTPLASRSSRGNIKGQPMPYFDQSHAQRKEYEIQPDTECWLIESVRADGYSRIRRGPRLFLGHVWFYEEYRDKIPDGMTLDHLCRTRNCVNPAHMEIVTLAENNIRRLQEETDLCRLEDFTYTVDPGTGCWNADMAQRDGYARVFVGGNVVAAHRIIYIRHRGSFPSWMQLDHLCLNKCCVNPSHLEPVTRLENVRRSVLARTKFNPDPHTSQKSLDAAGIKSVK